MARTQTKITKDDVQYAAGLIMVQLSDEETNVIVPQLQAVLANVDKLDEVNTSTIGETHHVTGLKNVLREDEVLPSLSQEEALSNAAETQDGYIKVAGKLSAGADA